MIKETPIFPILLSVLAILIAIFAYTQSSRTESTHAKTSITTRTLKVAIVPAPPASLFEAGPNKATGHSVDIMNEIAKRSSLKISYTAGNWATVGAALNSGQVDIVIGPVFMSEARAAEYLFSKPVYNFAIVPVVGSNGVGVKSLDDMKRPGLRVAVGRGGFDADFVAKNMPQARVSEFPPDDPNLAMLEVKAGRADIAIVDYGTAIRFAEQNSGLKVLENLIVSRQYAGFMLRSTDAHLKEFLDVALRNLQLSGEMARINRTYETTKIWYDMPDLR